MKRSLLLTTLIVLSFCLFGTPIKEKEIVLKTKECKIYGTLKLPVTKEKVPVVMIIAGSGPTDRDCNSPSLKCNTYKMLTDSLNRYGIATLSYDKRGIGKSVMKQKEEELCFEDYVEDAKNWIDLLSKNKQFSEIIVVGHSEGSLIGMIAAQNNPKVSKYISLAGTGLPADEILKEQLTERLKGQPENLKEQAFEYIDELKQGKLLEKVSVIWYSLFRPTVQPYLISWFKYNPQEEIKKLDIPILILQGDLDIQVSEKDAELLYLANPNAKKVIIENMNHVLKNSQSTDLTEQTNDSYNNPTSPINRELVEQIVGFLGIFSLKAQEMNEKEKHSYAVGVILGEKIKEKIAESGIDLGIFESLKETIKEKIDFKSLKNGLQDILNGECKISKEEIGSVLEEILKKAGEIEKMINEKK